LRRLWRYKKTEALEENFDSDEVLHAITNAISGITGKPILGPVADKLCKAGVTNSAVYLDRALDDLVEKGFRISHVSVSIECARPKILPIRERMVERLAELLGVTAEDIGITATTGEGLTDFGRGLGVQAMAVVTGERG
jgi:2-C-methyl-D-erythritol 2,4-cyclodiphosphate synthase